MATFRSAEGEEKYRAVIKSGVLEKSCPLCESEAVLQFRFWKVIPNSYPYDKIAKRHDMLLPIRHAKESELTSDELAELSEIKETYAHAKYEYIVESTHHKKSIPGHFHLHLIDAKD